MPQLRGMKQAIFFLPFVAVAAFLFSSEDNEQQYSNRTSSHKRNKVMEPYDHLTYMRSYPYNTFDVKAYNLAMNDAAQFSKNTRGGLAWQLAGPLNINGRINSVVVNPTNANEMYAGACFGGVFKTTDGGTNWSPIFDGQPNLPIGAIEMDPANASRVWVGTGDNNISGNVYVGGGIYLTTDGGSTWTNKGLANTYIVSKIIVDPGSSNTIYAATMGNPFNPDNNRGLYKSTDGGTTWTQKLYINDSTGVIDLIMDPNNSNVLYASAYTRIRTCYRSTYHSDQCKIYKTTDGGTTWNILSGGLPTGDIGRIGLANSATNSNVLYCIVTAINNYVEGVYKSTDGGATWVAKNSADLETVGSCYGGFGWYFGRIHVNPTDDNNIYVYGVDKMISYDGGDSWNLFAPDWSTYEVHADGHDLAFIDGNTMVLATDGGLYKTSDNGFTWTDIDNMPTTQFYHVTHLPTSTETFYGGAQDNGTIGGDQFSPNFWNWEFGGDGFKFYASPTDIGLRYYETQWAGIYFDDNGSFGTLDAGFSGSERFNWDTPYMLDHFDPSIVYLGSENMWKMTGAPYGTFVPISTDLTNGPVIPLADGNTISTIAQSYFDQNTLFVGTSDAHVWVTTNGGTAWNDITTGLPNRYVTSVNTSPNVDGNVYISFSGYRLNDNAPHVYKSTNNGTSWTSIQGDLPNFAVNDILVFPGDESHIIVGTDAGVYHSVNGGVNWLPMGTGMPMVAVMELEFNENATVLSAATFGRAIMVMDVSSFTSVTEQVNTTHFEIFPNPLQDQMNVRGLVTGMEFSIYSMKGQLVRTGVLSGTAVNVAILPKGTYVFSAGGQSKRFIKQ